MSVWKSVEKLLIFESLNLAFDSSKLVKNTPLRVVFSILFSVLYLMLDILSQNSLAIKVFSFDYFLTQHLPGSLGVNLSLNNI